MTLQPIRRACSLLHQQTISSLVSSRNHFVVPNGCNFCYILLHFWRGILLSFSSDLFHFENSITTLQVPFELLVTAYRNVINVNPLQWSISTVLSSLFVMNYVSGKVGWSWHSSGEEVTMVYVSTVGLQQMDSFILDVSLSSTHENLGSLHPIFFSGDSHERNKDDKFEAASLY